MEDDGVDDGAKILGMENAFPSDDDFIKLQRLKWAADMSVLGAFDLPSKDDPEALLSRLDAVSSQPGGRALRSVL
jgi:hypothetical protein